MRSNRTQLVNGTINYDSIQMRWIYLSATSRISVDLLLASCIYGTSADTHSPSCTKSPHSVEWHHKFSNIQCVIYRLWAHQYCRQHISRACTMCIHHHLHNKKEMEIVFPFDVICIVCHTICLSESPTFWPTLWRNNYTIQWFCLDESDTDSRCCADETPIEGVDFCCYGFDVVL